jgi:uncharacterized repeat protein (TIGR01451 family)
MFIENKALEVLRLMSDIFDMNSAASTADRQFGPGQLLVPLQRILMIGALAACCHPVNAQTTTVTVPNTAVSFSHPFTLPTFDPSLGTLTGVEIDVSTTFTVNQTIVNASGTFAGRPAFDAVQTESYNNASGTGTVTVTSGAPTNLNIPLTATSTAHANAALPGGGGAGATNTFTGDMVTAPTNTTHPADIADYICGTPGHCGAVTIALNFAAGVLTENGSTPDNDLYFNLSGSASGSVTVTYTYTPAVVPTPPAPLVPDMTITKSHTGNFNLGQVGATFTINTENIGPVSTSSLTPVTVTDTLPAGLTATAISGSGWNCTLSTLTCTRNDILAPFTSFPPITVTVNVAVNAASTLTNVAVVGGGGETNLTNDTATDTVINNPPPDMTITKHHTGNFTLGQTGATFTIGTSNVGASPTNGTPVTVTEIPPAGLTATGLAGTGWTCSVPTLNCTRSDVLAPGAAYPPITVTVNVANNATSPLLNTAVVGGGGEINLSNDTATDSVILIIPDMTITKSHTGSFSLGQIGATYTVTTSNVGTAPTMGQVMVVDTIPAGLTATAISGTGWTCTLGSVSCTRSDVLAVGAFYPPITVTVNVALTAPALVTNTAVVSGGGEVNLTNDTATDPTPLMPIPDMTITKSHTGNFSRGQIGATYTVIASNVGPVPTTAPVSVTDTIPAGLTLTGMSGAGWSCSGATCTRNDVLAAGAAYPPITVTVNVAPDAPLSITNVAMVSGGGEKNLLNDTASDPTIIVIPDMTITKSHTGTFQRLGTGTYTVTASNIGPAPTYGQVSVTDTLPTGLTATAINGTGWTCTLTPLTCTRSDVLASGAAYPPITVTVSIAVDAPNPVINTAVVSGGGETNLTNDTATDPTSLAGGPDLTITKSHTSIFSRGGSANYTITASNVGTLPTTGLSSVVDTLPSGLTATAISGTGWTCTLATLTCTRSDVLAAGAAWPPITVAVNVAANAPSSLINTAVVSGGGETNLTNDTATDPTVIADAPLLTLTKTHSGALAKGGTGVYLLTITNGGTIPTSAPVSVNDPLPSYLTLVAISGTGWTCDFNSVTCTRTDSLAPGNSFPPISLTVNIAANAPSTIVNVANATGGGGPAGSGTDIAPAATLDPTITVTKVVDHATANTGDVISYQVQVTNTHTAPITSTVITDRLPLGFNYINGSAQLIASGAAAQPINPGNVPGILTFSLGTLAPQASVTIIYRVRVSAQARSGDNMNSANLVGLGPGGAPIISTTGSARVTVGGGVFTLNQFLIGRVFEDLNGNGIFDKGERPVAGVRVYISSGESATTDSKGLYNIPVIAPGSVVVSIDPATIPKGYTISSGGRLDAESWSRLVRTPLLGGAMLRQNFALKRCPNCQLAPAPSAPSVAGASGPVSSRPPVKIEILPAQPSLPGDGRSTMSVQVRVLDDQGNLVPAKEIRVRTSAGQFIIDPNSNSGSSSGASKQSGLSLAGSPLFGKNTAPQSGQTIEQVPESMQAGMARSTQGEASFMLLASNTPGVAHLTAESGDPEHLLSATTDIYFNPEKRSPILVSDGEITVGRAAPDVEIYGQSGTVTRHVDAFLRTPLGDDLLMTLAYTSHLTLNSANGNPGLFQLDPLDRVYPVFGDSSTQYQAAQSNSHVYGRLDYGQSYALFGDIRMGTPPGNGFPAPASQAFAPQPGAPQPISYSVGEYNRNVIGAAVHLEDAHHDSITVEGARPNTAFARDVFPGSTFGLIQLSHVDLLPGSETGAVEVRDVHNPEILISREILVRSVDYTIDPFSGGVFFLRTLNTYDQSLNLVQVVFTYEYTTFGGTSSVYGIRGDLRLNSLGLRLGLGVTDQRDPTAGSYYLGDINLQQKLPNSGRLTIEVPISHGSALAAGYSSSVTGASLNEVNGTAIRADLDQPFNWLRGRFRGSFSKTDEGFFNPFGASVIPGAQTARGSVELSPLKKTRIKFGFTDERNRTSLVNNQRQTGSFELKQSLTETLVFTGGYDFRDFQDTFNNRRIDSNELAAGFDWKPFNRFTATVRREQNLTDSDPTYPNETILTARYQATETVRLFLTQRLASAPIMPIGDLSNTGFTALSGKNETSLGVEDKWSRYTSIESRYLIENGINGTDTFAVIGLVNRIPVQEHLTLDLGMDRGQLITGKDGSFNSGSVGFSWLPKKNFRTSTRYEVRSLGGLGQIFTTGAAGRIADGLTMLGRFQVSNAAFQPGTGAVDLLNPLATNSTLSTQTSADQATAALAWRPWKTDREGILFAYTLRDSNFTGVNTTLPQNDHVGLLSTDGYYQANRYLEFYGKVAFSDRTYNYVGTAPESNRTWLYQARTQAKISRRFDLAVEARFVVQPDTSTDQWTMGTEVGFWAVKDLRAALGYNFKSADQIAANFLTNPAKQGVYFVLTSKLSNMFNLFNANECTCTVQPAAPPPPPPPPPPVLVQPITGVRNICAGDNLVLQTGGSGGPQGSTLTYQWLVNGVPVPGATGTSFTLPATGMPGTQTITARASAGNMSAVSDPVTVTVRPLLPPTIQFGVSPSTVAFGAPAIPLSATANAANECNGRLAVTFSGEAVTGASFDPAAVGGFDPANRIRQQTRTIPLTATVTDQHNQTASAVANVTITLNPVATRRDIVFPNRSTRVNNAAKRYLIEELTPQLRNDPNSTVILVGHRDTTETGPAAANLDTERALNAAAVLSAGTGVCPSLDLSRIQVSSAGTDQTTPPLPFGDASVLERPGQAVSATDQSAPFRRVEVWFIPGGADQPAVSGLQPAPVQTIQTRGCPR